MPSGDVKSLCERECNEGRYKGVIKRNALNETWRNQKIWRMRECSYCTVPQVAAHSPKISSLSPQCVHPVYELTRWGGTSQCDFRGAVISYDLLNWYVLSEVVTYVFGWCHFGWREKLKCFIENITSLLFFCCSSHHRDILSFLSRSPAVQCSTQCTVSVLQMHRHGVWTLCLCVCVFPCTQRFSLSVVLIYRAVCPD